MKHFLYLICITICLCSCEKTDDSSDTTSGNSDIHIYNFAITYGSVTKQAVYEGTHSVGDLLIFDYTATDDDSKLSGGKMYETVDGGSKIELQDFSISGRSTTVHNEYTISDSSASSIILEFTVSSSSNGSTSKTYTVSVK
ncbi:hypothetical protein JYT59_01425 [Sphingobacteriaceae bacterium AH-315-L07]|nr:hypothetical protein [Bacteroidia bacterium]MBN4052392.1 hypothetical protein [Sphingobacteriaceae bacterium AH-315-L07]